MLLHYHLMYTQIQEFTKFRKLGMPKAVVRFLIWSSFIGGKQKFKFSSLVVN
jgi:hypothetical protein